MIAELIEMRDYAIYDDILIFKPKFNKPVDEYANLIQNYTQIIFSNYTDLKIISKTNNKYEYKYEYSNKYNCNKFNQKIQLNPELTHLTFGNDFNQEIQLNRNLTHLIFGRYFNQKIK